MQADPHNDPSTMFVPPEPEPQPQQPATARVGDRQPAPHQRYVVIRDRVVFTATPCYGMHSPWWVETFSSGQNLEPVAMQDGDLWVELDAAIDVLEKGLVTS